MANPGCHDAERPQRRRRGPPPRLYVIARQSPVPWLRVRRLGDADRAALTLHFGRLAEAQRRPRGRSGLDEAGIAALCAGLDFTRMIAFAAIAGNAIIAVACGVPGLCGPEIGVTEDPDYLGRDLGTVLVSQVLGTQAGAIALAPPSAEAERLLLRLVQSLGGRMAYDQDVAETA
ncbi:hypothetical protein ACFQS7_10765 [Dankookia sp. GCM10030260]|uniref:hypothetical protein n=1 Tax=Dankookia sp. GCM10030260 TaxID=3273390 RepID=UPI00361A4426